MGLSETPKRRGRKPKAASLSLNVVKKEETNTIVNAFCEQHENFLWLPEKIESYKENIQANYNVQSIEIFSVEFIDGFVRVLYDVQADDVHFQREIKIDILNQGIPFATTIHLE